jgi:PleD family two-component response regulator
MNTRNHYSTERIGEPQTVLVVDDDPIVRSVEAQLLSSQGYNVLQAESGAEALRLADSATIHLLLTDFLIPDVDGLELSNSELCIQRRPCSWCQAHYLRLTRELKIWTTSVFCPNHSRWMNWFRKFGR